LKDVKFPLVLDVYDLCTEELKKKLAPNRETLRKKRDDELLNKYKKTEEKEEIKQEEEVKYEIEELAGNSTGCYELFGLVTHKGRSADSGHYVGWVKENDRWVQFDDDKVQEVSEDDIKKLSGGGDWHTSYILFYRSKNEKGEFISQ
jgi:ubiquitin carboxyl-terminal hydrolase 14